MELSNREEYKLVRDEMQNLKNCITNYLGFVLVGYVSSFVAVFAVHDFATHYEHFAFISLLLALMLSVVLSIMVYKFESHNRYAGYCKLLNQEQLLTGLVIDPDVDPEIDPDRVDMMSWETCVDRLRKSDFELSPFETTLKELSFWGIISQRDEDKIRIHVGRSDSAAGHMTRRGFKMLSQLMGRKSESTSWHFPLYVVRVFFALSVIYVLSSLLCILCTFPSLHWVIATVLCAMESFTYAISSITLPIIAYVLLFLILIAMWAFGIARLLRQMEGSSTVEAYCWKFLPLRYTYIMNKKELKYHIRYTLITLKDV